MRYQITSHSSDKVTKKIIDFGLSHDWVKWFVANDRIYHTSLESDHRRYATKLTKLAHNIARFRPNNPLKHQAYKNKA